ncbi:hypothetical protein [Actinacidiphila glaucinigra]|uniref:hypothetical protein n=1 Tax=Actinacidiphila glaucinigra TaxID=235986 RepID=UPI0036E7F6CB
MVLLEPALPYAAGEPPGDAMRRAVAAAAEGDWHGLTATSRGSVCSPGYLDVMTRVIGTGGFRKSVLSGRYFFEHERAAFAAWDADAAGLEALRRPVLLVAGGEGERLGSPYRARNRAPAARLPAPSR